jgi:MerR family transcriptional regulator, heat shock protein HspR
VTTRRHDTRPLFMIGVAAELAGMHPQTLRMYERRGLVRPSRTARNTRLYSHADVALLARIQDLSESGLNLAGIERVLDLERRLARAERRIADLQAELEATVQAAREDVARARAGARAEIVHVRRAVTAVVPRYAPVVPTPPRTTR